MKSHAILLLALLTLSCGRGSNPQPPRPPAPVPSETPIATPTPDQTSTPDPQVSPTPSRPKPTPYPTPQFDPAAWFPKKTLNTTVTLSLSRAHITTELWTETVEKDIAAIAGKLKLARDEARKLDDIGFLISAANAALENSPFVALFVISDGGKIITQGVVGHDSEWTGEYFCETQTLEGCVLVHNNTNHEGKGATFYEPTFFAGTPAITVFQTFSSAKDNYSSSENVTIKGFKIIGRQEKTDGGVRQSISFGNCKNCAAIENDLSGIASIGIQFGGGAAKGNHAENSLAYRNKLRRFAAAAIALVNVKGAIVTENDIADPGRRAGEPGGISGIDIESNNTDDCVKDIKIFNNRIGYGNAAFFSAGNGILGQNVYKTPCSGGLLIANNVIDGYEGRGGDGSAGWGLSGGLFFNGNWEGGLVVNNQVIRALQAAISMYGVSGLTIQDAWIISSGGGGSAAVYLSGSSNNAFLNNRIFVDESIVPGSVTTHFQCINGSVNNRIENLEDGGAEGCQ